VAQGGTVHVHQLKITLRDTEVWRRLQVPSAITFSQLHDALQVAMGWENRHLHDFEVGGVTYGTDDGESWEEPPSDERHVHLEQVVAAGGSFVYQYDFGDAWYHDIEVEAVWPVQPGQRYLRCLDGGGTCPPEDCGGVWGFGDLLVVMADPTHEEYPSMRGWLGGDFDPDRFDLDTINEALLHAALR
jgi:hypothetical protein